MVWRRLDDLQYESSGVVLILSDDFSNVFNEKNGRKYMVFFFVLESIRNCFSIMKNIVTEVGCHP